jgi:DNA-binding MarR family transcriptional regulator
LRRAWYGLNQSFRRRLAHLGITPDQFTVLRTLLESDPAGLTQRELTHSMTSDPNTVASLLQRMEEAGLIARKPHEKDKRAHRIHLQDAGRRKFEAARLVAVA